MQGSIVRVFADAVPQAEWFSVFFAIIIGVFVLLFVLVTCVAIFTSDADRRRTCHEILRDLIDFFLRRRSK